MEFRAVLFDLDNTLFDHLTSARGGLDTFVRSFGVELTPDLSNSWFEIEQANYDLFLSGELSFHAQRRERLRQFLPLIGHPGPVGATELDEVFAIYLRSYEEAWTAFPDAVPTLELLRSSGTTVGVITNGNHEQQAKKIKRIGIEPLLDLFFSSEQMGHAKPTSSAFILPCEKMGISPSQVLYVGDNFRVDIEGARAAGLQAIHLDREDAGQPMTLRSLTDLVPLLKIEATAP
ncbi:MAG: HAD family hydrolase [Micrococcaceae bacterium]|uniref:HAD family hydrolase n=1 Tax=unclassified Arthrobacter TaxID=235627 RepID=UPI00264EF468|nr:HAD family hydrolase [Yaniella sp.]MDN5813077.1 HAD family hydrolase [Micrococcaceae bacterium]MDN5823958.1 HAD family hydrolase [Micrococcaceae bacterium]MDN6177275.1 HAD family hydrolase [Micrococcaceae bacterium]MDN6201259.1 HAD family hydrolase [Micrococcaceae bacterium]